MTSLSTISSPSQSRTVRVIALSVLAMWLTLLAVNAWLVVRERDTAMRIATTADTNLTRAIAQQMDSVFSQTSVVLDTIAFEMDHADRDPTTLRRLQPVLVNYAAGIEHLHSLFVFDGQGRRVLSSEATLSPLPAPETRDYFTFHRDSLSLLSHIGKPIVSRLSGIWLIPVSRRLNDADGAFAGVVVATIEVAYIRHLLAEYEIGPDGTLSLWSVDGTSLARLPLAETDIGKSVAGTAQFAQLQKHLAGTMEMTSPVDGIERLVSHQYLKNNPLLVTVASSKQAVLLPWRAAAYVQTSWVLLLCGLVGLLGSVVIRSVRARLKIEHRLLAAHDKLTVANTQLTQLARYDGMTGLANRRNFDEHFAREFANAIRTRRPLSLIMIDVDHFKLYNDTYGHPEGDRCLQALANAIAATVSRPLDLVARYGGEEIVVLLAETDMAGAAMLAESIRQVVAQLQLPFSTSTEGHVSVSAGVAAQMFATPKTNPVELLNRADRALYRAKREGRNRVRLDL